MPGSGGFSASASCHACNDLEEYMLKGPWILIGAILGLLFVGLLFYRAFFIVFIDNYEIGYKYDAMNGKITVAEHPGWIHVNPFTQSVNTVDMRPMQVCINANARVLNCKLVQFNKDGLELFLSWHGRNYGFLEEILKSYAYDGSGKSYPFLKIVRELKPDDAEATPIVPSTNEDQQK